MPATIPNGFQVLKIFNPLGGKKVSYSLLRFLLKKFAHSEQVFLLPTQKTGEIPTIKVIRYFIRNNIISGLANIFTWGKKKKRPFIKHTKEKWFVLPSDYVHGAKQIVRHGFHFYVSYLAFRLNNQPKTREYSID